MSWPSILVSLSQPVCGARRSPHFPQLTWMHHLVSHTCEEPDIPARNKCFPIVTIAMQLHVWPVSFDLARWLGVLPGPCGPRLYFIWQDVGARPFHLKASLWYGISVQTRHKPFLNTGSIAPIFNYIVRWRPRHRAEAKHHVSKAYNSEGTAEPEERRLRRGKITCTNKYWQKDYSR